MNPDPRLFAPDDTARQMEVVGCDHQREAFVYADGGAHLERGAVLRKVADRTVEGGAAAERDPARLQKSPSWRCSVIVHHLDLRREQGSFRRPKLLSSYRWRTIQPNTTQSGGL